MWKTLSQIILKNRFIILVVFLMLTIFMFQKGQQVSLSYSVAQLLPEDHQINIDYKNFVSKYGDQNIFVIAIEDSNLTHYSHLISLDSLENKIRSIRGVNQILCITNLPILSKDTILKKFVFRDWLSSDVNDQQKVDSAFNIFENQLLYKGYFNTLDNRVTTLIISLDEKTVRSSNRESVIFGIKDFVENYCQNNQSTSYYSGLPYIRTVDSLMVKDEILLFILLALIITGVGLFLFFKSFKATFSSIIVVLLGVIFCFGIIGIFGYDISIFMALVPPVIIVIGIPNCIFLINKFHIEFVRSRDKEKSLKLMIQKIGNITLLTNLTTSAGFASFMLTNSQTLQEFGLVASLSIILIFCISLFIIPIYFSFASDPKQKHTQHLKKKWVKNLISYLVFLVQQKKKEIYLVSIGLVIAAIFGVLKIKNTGNITDDLPKDQALYKDLQFLEKNFGGVLPLEILIDTKKKRGLLKSYNLNKMEELIVLLENYEEFSKPNSYIDFIKYSKQAFYNGDTSYYSLPNNQERGMIMKYIKNSSDSLIFTTSLMDSLQQEARISFRVADISTSHMDSVFSSLIPEINRIFEPSKYNVSVTGSSIVFLNGAKFLLNNLMLSLLIVIILISIFMAWMFNSFRMVIISIIPNLIPLFLTAAIMGYSGIPLKPSTILIFSIAFGISVDDTIHFLAKYRQELLANNRDIRKSVVAALRETGISMFYTSVVLFSGFFIFVLSDFGGTIALGFLVSITLMIAMLANLLLLPALLLSLERGIKYDAFEDSNELKLDEN